MGQEIRSSNTSKFLTQAGRLLSEFGKQRLLFPPRVSHAYTSHRFQRRRPGVDLAAKNALRFRENFQECQNRLQ